MNGKNSHPTSIQQLSLMTGRELDQETVQRITHINNLLFLKREKKTQIWQCTS